MLVFAMTQPEKKTPANPKTALQQWFQQPLCFLWHKSTRKLYGFSLASTLRVGSSAQNDLIVLDDAVPAYAGTLEVKRQRLGWVDADQNTNPLSLWPKKISHQLWMWGAPRWICMALACVLMMLLWSAWNTPQSRIPSQVLQYELPARHQYGHLLDKLTPVHRIEFYTDLDPTSAYTLLFTPGNIQEEGDVVIKINDQKVVNVVASPNNWAREQRVLIDASMWQGTTNVIAFESTKDLPTWGVRNVYMQKTNIQDQKQHQEIYDIAYKLFVERNAKPGNLMRSIMKLQKLKDVQGGFLDASQQELWENAHFEMNRMKERYLTDARLLIRNDRKQKAQHYYRALLRELIDPTDSFRNQVVDEMYSQGVRP